MALKLEFLVSDKATPEIKKLQSQLNQLNPKIADTEKGFAGVSKNLIKVASGAAIAATAYKALNKVVSDGFAFNKSIEESTAGLIALSVAVQNKSIPVMERYNKANREALKTLTAIRKINVETPHTLDQTNQIYKAMYPSMKAVGATTSELVELTRSMSIASGAAGIEFRSLLSSVDGLASGTVLANSDLGRFLKSLGITNEELKKSKNVTKLLVETFKDFKAADTMAVSMSNLENSWSSLAGAMTKDIFESAKDNANELATLLTKLETGYKYWTQEIEDTKDIFAIDNVKDLSRQIKRLEGDLTSLQGVDTTFMWNTDKKALREEIESKEKLLAISKNYRIDLELENNEKETSIIISEKTEEQLKKEQKVRDELLKSQREFNDMWNASEDEDRLAIQEQRIKNYEAEAQWISSENDDIREQIQLNQQQISLHEDLVSLIDNFNPYDSLNSRLNSYLKEAKGNKENLLLIDKWYYKELEKINISELKKAKDEMEDTMFSGWTDTVSKTFADGIQDAFNQDFNFDKIARGLANTTANTMVQTGSNNISKSESWSQVSSGDIWTTIIGVAVMAVTSQLDKKSASEDRLKISTDRLREVNRDLLDATIRNGDLLQSTLGQGGDLLKAYQASVKKEKDYYAGSGSMINSRAIQIGGFTITTGNEALDQNLSIANPLLVTAQTTQNLMDAYDQTINGGEAGQRELIEQLLNPLAYQAGQDFGSEWESNLADAIAGTAEAENGLKEEINNAAIDLANWSLSVINATDEIEKYGKRFQGLYDDLSGTNYFSDISGKSALTSVNSVFKMSLTDLLKSLGTNYEIGNVEQFKKDLASDVNSIAYQQANAKASKLLTEFGQEAINSLDMISEATQYQIKLNEQLESSKDNMKSWTDSFKTDEELASEMIGEFFYKTSEMIEKQIRLPFGRSWTYGVVEWTTHIEELATSMEELSVIYERMANDADGLTDAELEALNANKSLIEERQNLIDSAVETFTSNMKTMADSIDSTILTLRNNTLSTSELTSEQIRRINETQMAFESSISGGDSEKAKELLAEITSLSTGIASSTFGDKSSISQNLISQLEANKAMIDFKDEILNVRIVASDISTTATAQVSTPSVYVTNSSNNDYRLATLEAIMMELLKNNKNMYTAILEIQNNGLKAL